MCSYMGCMCVHLLMKRYGLLPVSGAGVGMMGMTAGRCKSVLTPIVYLGV